MRYFVGKHKGSAVLATVLVGCSMLSLILWSVSGSARGQLVAHLDMALGHYEVLGYGLPPPWRPEYARLLQSRYGVKFNTVALCIVSSTLVDYADSYNRVTIEAVNRKFGHNVFKECEERARKRWEQTPRHQPRSDS